MNATLWNFDSVQWGGLAFGAFIATLAYCTAYITGTQQSRFGNVDFSGVRKGRTLRLMLTTTALCALATFSFSSAVFIALQLLTRAPVSKNVEIQYFSEVLHGSAAALASQAIRTATIRVLEYDGLSNARVFVNHDRVFESSVHCRFKHQCRQLPVGAPGPSASATAGLPRGLPPAACQKLQCETVGGKRSHAEIAVPVLRISGPSASGVSVWQGCDPLQTMVGVRNCEACRAPADCSFREVNWQRGIATNDHALPYTIDIKRHLQGGKNVLEVAAENSGVGSCRLSVELLITSADGTRHPPHVFTIDGPRKQQPREPGPRYGVEPRREPFTTCDRLRMKLTLGGIA